MGNLKKFRRVFRLRNFTRNHNDPERLPLFMSQPSTSRSRSPSISSCASTNSSSSSTATRSSLFKGYGSFLPSFNILRNPFRRSNSSQVRERESVREKCRRQRKEKDKHIELRCVLTVTSYRMGRVTIKTLQKIKFECFCLKNVWQQLI